eukprot:7395548-Alexandrium_andersonii.AAC.1
MWTLGTRWVHSQARRTTLGNTRQTNPTPSTPCAQHLGTTAGHCATDYANTQFLVRHKCAIVCARNCNSDIAQKSNCLLYTSPSPRD